MSRLGLSLLLGFTIFSVGCELESDKSETIPPATTTDSDDTPEDDAPGDDSPGDDSIGGGSSFDLVYAERWVLPRSPLGWISGPLTILVNTSASPITLKDAISVENVQHNAPTGMVVELDVNPSSISRTVQPNEAVGVTAGITADAVIEPITGQGDLLNIKLNTAPPAFTTFTVTADVLVNNGTSSISIDIVSAPGDPDPLTTPALWQMPRRVSSSL